MISGFLLTAFGEVEHLKFRASIASVIVSALSLMSDLWQIDSLKCLSEEDREQARAFLIGFFVIGIIVACIAIAMNALIGIVIGIVLNYVSAFASDAIVQLSKIKNSMQECSRQ